MLPGQTSLLFLISITGISAQTHLPASNFTGIAVDGPFQVNIEVSPVEGVIIQQDFVNITEILVSNGTLNIKLKEGRKVNSAIQVVIGAKVITSIVTSGDAYVTSRDTLVAETIRVKANGTSKVNVNFTTDVLDLEIRDSVQLASVVRVKYITAIVDGTNLAGAWISGTADHSIVIAAGNSYYHGLDLIAGTVRVTANDSADADVRTVPDGQIDLLAAGNATVRTRGTQNVHSTTVEHGQFFSLSTVSVNGPPSDITGIVVDGPFQVQINIGPVEGVVFHGDQSSINSTETVVENGTLNIRIKDGHSINGSVVIQVGANHITSLTTTGDAYVTSLTTLKAEAIHVKANGTSKVNVNFTANVLEIEVRESAQLASVVDVKNVSTIVDGTNLAGVWLSGSADSVNVIATGNSYYHGQDLIAKTVAVTANDTADADVQAVFDGQVNATVAGNSTVRTSGTPNVQSDLTDHGQIFSSSTGPANGPASNFTAVVVEGPFQVQIDIGPLEGVVFHSEQSSIDNTEIVIENGTLNIKVKDGHSINGSVAIQLGAVQITSLITTGDAYVTSLTTLQADVIRVKANGTSKVNVNFTADVLQLEVHESAQLASVVQVRNISTIVDGTNLAGVWVSGTADTSSVVASGDSYYHGLELVAGNVTLTAKDNADADVFAVSGGQIDVLATGNATVRTNGTQNVDKFTDHGVSP